MCLKMSLHSIKEEPPSDLDPNHFEHVEMTFECFETQPLSNIKEEHIIGTQTGPKSEESFGYRVKSVNAKEWIKEQHNTETKYPNTYKNLDLKVESEIKINDGTCGNEVLDHDIHEIKSSPVPNDVNSDFCSQSQNIVSVIQLQEDKCESTPYSQGNTDLYTKAMYSDNKPKVYDCSLCGKLFHSLETRRKHSKIHIKEKSYKCDVCSKTFALQSYLKRHKTIHASENEKLTCEYCFKKFSDNIRLRQHQNQVHLSVDRKYSCDICLKTFKLEGALKCHVQTHSDKKRYACEICNSSFLTRTTLIHHQKIHKQGKQFKCSFCGRSFLRLFHLKNHSAVHTGVKNFHCLICGKKFGHSSSLKQHQLVHTGERFACNICGKTYSRPAHMRLHVARAHTKIKKYSCEVCSNKFYTTGELMLHLRAHIGEKPFSCDVCKKTFVTLYRRDQHSHVHTNNKRYQCEACGKQYYTLKRLKGHVDKHRAQAN